MAQAIEPSRLTLRSRVVTTLLALALALALCGGWPKAGVSDRTSAMAAGAALPADGEPDKPGPGDLGPEQGDGGEGLLGGHLPALSPPGPQGRNPGTAAASSSSPFPDVPSPVPIGG